MIALYFKRSQRKMSYHPCPGEVSRNDARHIDGRWRRGVPTITRQLKFKEQKIVRVILSQPCLTQFATYSVTVTASSFFMGRSSVSSIAESCAA